MDYEEMLQRAKQSLPKKEVKERFIVPELKIINIGKQTIIKNFVPVVKLLHREPESVAKFLYKELAIPGSINKNELVLQGKISAEMIKKRFEDYLKEYVICTECGKYDTHLEKGKNFSFIKCAACGAKRFVKKV